MKKLAVLFLMLCSSQLMAQTPTITSFTPASGPGDTVVTITGTDLSTVTGVIFGLDSNLIPNVEGCATRGVVGGSFQALSATQVSATVPAILSENQPERIGLCIDNLIAVLSQTDFTKTVATQPATQPAPPPPNNSNQTPAPAPQQIQPAIPVPIDTVWALIIMAISLALIGGFALRRFG